MNNSNLEECQKISIIIPSYNRKDFLVEAIEKIFLQSYKNYEIIIIDDASNDGTEETINKKYHNNSNIKFFKNEKNSGAGFSRKAGYKKSTGEYIIFLDDDDYYTDLDFFKKAIDIFNREKDISFVSGNSNIKYEKENKLELNKLNIQGRINNVEYLKGFQTKYMKSNSTFTTVFSKKKLEEAEFDNLEMVNDSSIYLRALLSGDAYILEDVIGTYRIHSKNISFSINLKFLIENLEAKKDIYEIIKKKNMFLEYEKWWKEQVLLTTTFYVKNSNVIFDDFFKLLIWVVNNCKVSKEEIFNQLVRIKGKYENDE